MRAPEPGTGFAERCTEVCVGFRAVGSIRRARKSELLAGDVDGAPVIAKRLLRPNAVWDWYFAREIAIYRGFAASPPPFRVPRTHAAADDVLLIERLPVALAKLRRPYAEPTTATVDALLAYRDRIAEWTRFPDDAPPARVHAQLRQRLLEDPTDEAWIRDGLARCGERALIGEGVVEAALEALAAHPRIAPCHGDLLLRNVMERADGEVVLVDWECAGRHAADWDLALLWTQLAGAGRNAVESHVGGGPRHTAFLALVVFALCREVVFLDAFRVPAEHRGLRRVRDELSEVARRLGDIV